MAVASTLDVWSAVREERQALAADLETLTPEQWDAQSLCTEWKVRDVVAHLTGGAEGAPGLFPLMLRHGFNLTRVLCADAQRRATGRTPAELLASYRAIIDSKKMPPGAKPQLLLNDTIIHGQDIRRPLGIAHTFPPAHLEAALGSVRDIQLLIGSKKRSQSLQLRATDIGWTAGSGGPEVAGPAEALLMAMVGRSHALADLSGDGVATLRERMPKH